MLLSGVIGEGEEKEAVELGMDIHYHNKKAIKNIEDIN